jgi:hypothetical protein
MSDTDLAQIIHLDFEPKLVEEEKKEEERVCGIHYSEPPYFPDQTKCNRKAAYRVSVEKPCGHAHDVLFCEGHWAKANDDERSNPPYHLACGKCSASYPLFKHIRSWTRL